MMPRVLYWFRYFMDTRQRSRRTVEDCFRDALEVACFESQGPRTTLADFSIHGVPFPEWFAQQDWPQ